MEFTYNCAGVEVRVAHPVHWATMEIEQMMISFGDVEARQRPSKTGGNCRTPSLAARTGKLMILQSIRDCASRGREAKTFWMVVRSRQNLAVSVAS